MKKKIFSILFALVLVLALIAVPVMAKGPAGKGNPPELETLTVDADGTTATSTTTLVDDMWYRFEVSGTYFAGANITADAEYSSGPVSYTWQDLVEKYESYGEGLLELKVDDSYVEWGDYNINHTYSLYYIGVGSTVQFQIYDIYYPNNSGSLTVKIFAVVGYDEFGYNYQARMFNGKYCDYDRVAGGAYCDVNLIMKWNDAWLSNKDRDDDGKLDRHHGYDSYIGSGAWLTNHQSGSYEQDGKTYKWTYFVKIVAVPADATQTGGIWFTADSTEIGPVIWGSFAVILRVYNDQGTGEHGIEYLSPAGPGFGKW